MLNIKQKNRLLSILFLALSPVLFSTAWADGGGGGVETDFCRVDLAGETINFTAYVPQYSGPKAYCGEIPILGKTTLVFDLQGKNFTPTMLKKMKLGFELLKGKGDGGEAIFTKERKTYPTGTFNEVVDFSQYGEGNYTIRITTEHEGEEEEAHLAIVIGGGEAVASFGNFFLIAVGVFALGYILYLSNAGFKEKIDKVLKKGKEAI